MIDANLTRFGPATLVLGNVMEAKSSDAFKALQGPAQLIIRADRVQSLSITLNGSSVVESGVPLSRGEQVREVQLASDNTINIINSKERWSREEVVEIFNKMFSTDIIDAYVKKVDFDKWIEENTSGVIVVSIRDTKTKVFRDWTWRLLRVQYKIYFWEMFIKRYHYRLIK